MMQWSQLEFAETTSIALFAIAIWVVYLFFIFRRNSLPEATLRSLLLGIALFCLCLIIYKPQYRITQPHGNALLLTQPVNTIPDSVLVFALPAVQTPANVQKVPDLSFIERNYPEIKEVYIAGYSLEPAQTKGLQRLKVSFLEKEPPAGFRWLSYTRQVREGESLTVSGTYMNSLADTAKLLFSTVEGLQDSIVLSAGENRFSLQAHTQIAGKYIANLQLISGDSTRMEILPYIVEARKPLQVLMLQGFPSFEMNYLKDWLGQGKHRIQVRARISRDNYSMQRINTDIKESARPILSEENLNASDLLICDAESLRQLSAIEKNRLQNAVREGLGLLVLTDEEWLKRPEIIHHKFTITPSRRLSFIPRQIVQAAHGMEMADKLPAAFAANDMLIPVAYSQEEETVTACLPSGSGKVGALLATATFPWMLQGEAEVYSQFWTNSIQAVSRRQMKAALSLSAFPFIIQDLPATFTVTDTLLSPATINYTSGTQQLAMPEKGLLHTVEKAYQFLPSEKGWADIYYGEDSTDIHPIYVQPANAWTDLKQAYWWRQNQNIQSASALNSSYTYTAWQDVPLIWIFLLLIASMGFLWWREKK